MRLSKIYLKNYRSFKEIELDLKPHIIIIGENNVGKSNLLKILDYILGPRWPMPQYLSQDDFHNNNLSDPIIIKLTFIDFTENELLEFGSHISNDEMVVEFSCKYGADKSIFKFTHSGTWLRSPDRNKLPSFIFVPGIRDVTKQSAVNKWTLFGKLLDSIRKKVSTEVENEIVTKLKEANDVLLEKVPDLKELQSKLKETMNEQTAITDINFELKTYDPKDLFKNIEIHIDDGSRCGLACYKGMGLQSSLIVAIFRLFAEYTTDCCMFGVEEPEIYLHPQAQRFLSDTLKKISSNNQVIITTHSPFFIDDINLDNLILFRKISGETKHKKFQTGLLTPNELSKIKRNLDVGNGEMFFAKTVILCEGPSEKVALPIIAKKMNKDFNFKGISTIDVGSSGNFKPFLDVLTTFGIPAFVLRDQDASSLDLSSHLESSRIVTLSSDFEGVVGLTKIINAINNLYGSNFTASNVSSQIDTTKPLFKEIQRILPNNLKLSKPRIARVVAEDYTLSDIPEEFKNIVNAIYDAT